MIRRTSLFLACLFLSFPAVAAPTDVQVDLASDHIDITTGFDGTTLELFGVRHNRGDIAVVVRGPVHTMSVRRKESVIGAWINRSFETFKGVPSYYNYALSVPVERLASPDTLKRYGIGPENLQFNKPDSTDETRHLFREALIRNKQEQGLYPEKAVEVKFISPDFFRADFYIPSNVPVGDYEIQTFYFSNGVLQDSKAHMVRVAQVGVSASVHRYAYENSLMYGVLCVLLAIFAGWFSNRVRRG